MAAFDFGAARRWAHGIDRVPLRRRDDSELPFVGAGALGGQPLLLDTCVYIDQMRDHTPIALDELLAARFVNHSTVAIQELMHSVGVLDPSDPRTARAIAAVGAQIRTMRPHRTYTPDADVLGRAALLSGILCRRRGYNKDSKLRALQDCVLFLQALKEGFVLLTENTADYDILSQMVPSTRMLFYRNTQVALERQQAARRLAGVPITAARPAPADDARRRRA